MAGLTHYIEDSPWGTWEVLHMLPRREMLPKKDAEFECKCRRCGTVKVIKRQTLIKSRRNNTKTCKNCPKEIRLKYRKPMRRRSDPPKVEKTRDRELIGPGWGWK